MLASGLQQDSPPKLAGTIRPLESWFWWGFLANNPHLSPQGIFLLAGLSPFFLPRWMSWYKQIAGENWFLLLPRKEVNVWKLSQGDKF